MVRIKNRYLLLNILYPEPNSSKGSRSAQLAFNSPTPDYIDAGRFIAHLRNHISLLFGDYGLGASLSSLKVIYFSCATSTVILRAPRNNHRLVWAALTHMTEIPAPQRGQKGKACVVRVVRVSGTIRKAEEELIRRSRKEVVRAKLMQQGSDNGVVQKMVRGKPVGSQPRKQQHTNTVETIEDLSGSDEDISD